MADFEFRDDRLKNQPIKSQSERDREAHEYFVKHGVETARKLGNENVTEDQVRREITQIVEGASAKRDRGGYRNQAPQTRTTVPDEVFIEE